MILTLNAGSSSLKFAFFASQGTEIRWQLRGRIEGVGTDMGRVVVHSSRSAQSTETPVHTPHQAAGLELLWDVLAREKLGAIAAVGHRVVHGGPDYVEPVLLNNDHLDRLEELIPFAPLHQPAQVELIRQISGMFPDILQIACFDTAIHHALPDVAARYPFPEHLWQSGVRKYGFHGLSCESILEQVPAARQGRTIIAHLGNGSSLTAFLDGHSVETTMGFTPTGGVMMGTRCGDLDPGVLLHLQRQHGYSIDDLEQLVNRQSGLKGVSGKTQNVQDLFEMSEEPAAVLAIEMFCYQISRAIGSLAAVLNGLDRLIFTGGIGEHSSPVRQQICARLGFLGIELDEKQNQSNSMQLNNSGHTVQVLMCHTDEEDVIARHSLTVIRATSSPSTGS